jgi:hypothetical protein
MVRFQPDPLSYLDLQGPIAPVGAPAERPSLSAALRVLLPPVLLEQLHQAQAAHVRLQALRTRQLDEPTFSDALLAREQQEHALLGTLHLNIGRALHTCWAQGADALGQPLANGVDPAGPEAPAGEPRVEECSSETPASPGGVAEGFTGVDGDWPDPIAPSSSPVEKVPAAPLKPLDVQAAARALRANFLGTGRAGGPAAVRLVAPPARLPPILDQLGEPPERFTSNGWSAELRRLDAALADRGTWAGLSAADHVRVIEWVTARLRALQECSAACSGRVPDIADRFALLHQHVEQHRPGYVYGLAVRHQPNAGSWQAEARRLVGRLRANLASPERAQPAAWAGLAGLAAGAAPAPGSTLGGVPTPESVPASAGPSESSGSGVNPARSAAPASGGDATGEPAPFSPVQAGKAPSVDLPSSTLIDPPEPSPAQPLQPDSVLLVEKARARVQGARALMVGGNPRETSRLRILSSLALGELVWATNHNPRRFESKVRSVRTREFDLVIVLKGFVSHSATNALFPAAKAAGVPVAWAAQGYGLQAISQAIVEAIPKEKVPLL